MILVLAITFTALCVAASLRRLVYVIELTPVDDGALAAGIREALARDPCGGAADLAAGLESVTDADWERSLLDAMRHAGDARAALLGESMTELDFRARRWASVPRVSASLASSFGFLLATTCLRVGLSDVVDATAVSAVVTVNGAVLDALDVAAVGLVGAALCIAIQRKARSALAARLAGAVRLLDLLEGIEEPSGARQSWPDTQASDGGATPLAANGEHDTVMLPQGAEAVPSVPPPVV